MFKSKQVQTSPNKSKQVQTSPNKSKQVQTIVLLLTLLLSFTLFADDSKVHYLFTEEKLSENQISQKIKVLYSPFLQIRSIEINPRLSSEQGVKKGDKVIINLADDKEYHATITKTSQRWTFCYQG